ncbi:hypothetical protein K505DRAFT_325419 [Melanomma pulvis-pyrius CBS 109.77]|uniref:Uncharacterized protein n=1 Tax=Melanomma pulvis-pyrius CBS 109.77 TaxID=1314802 RepID=A0A6A6XC69_9PLEO|nr:hypothetical protein K505DRAFT_325419 [Melanomma pulvis-pyrius CBS 109.77]
MEQHELGMSFYNRHCKVLNLLSVAITLRTISAPEPLLKCSLTSRVPVTVFTSVVTICIVWAHNILLASLHAVYFGQGEKTR